MYSSSIIDFILYFYSLFICFSIIVLCKRETEPKAHQMCISPADPGVPMVDPLLPETALGVQVCPGFVRTLVPRIVKLFHKSIRPANSFRRKTIVRKLTIKTDRYGILRCVLPAMVSQLRIKQRKLRCGRSKKKVK